MAEGIFAANAARYWERGLMIIPLKAASKEPAAGLTNWPGYLAAVPSEARQKQWMVDYANAGIGLLLGQPIGDYKLLGLDFDDDRLLPLAEVLIGGPLVGKRGRRGATFFVRVPRDALGKRKSLTGAGGLGNIDLLGGGKYTVMPPSIHPGTGLPYVDYGKPILEVELTDLPVVSKQKLSVIGTAIGSEHALTLMGGEATHDAAVSFVATLVSGGANDQQVSDVIQAFLPAGYSGNTLSELPGLIESARAKGFDQPSGKKEPLSASLVNLATNKVIELFNDGDGMAYASVAADGGTSTYRVTGDGFKSWLRYQAHNTLDRPVGTGPLLEAIAGIEAMALFEGQSLPTYVRVAGDNRLVEIDLGTKDGAVVVIAADGWRIERSATYKFVRGGGFEQLPLPIRGGSIRDLQDLLGMDDRNFRLLIAFILNALKPTGPFFILLVEGEQGSGKSFVCEIIKKIIDPNKASRLRLPDNDRDLMIQAKEYRLLNFDNASGMKADMSDALCSLATGGGIAVRKLYTDGELHVMVYVRPFVMNGISGYVNRPDLMERAIPIRLPAMPEDGRKTEAEMTAAFKQILPGLLGALYDAVALALQNVDIVDPPRQLRMADAARWIRAAEGILGYEPGILIDAIAEAQREFVVERVNDEPLVMKLREIAKDGAFEGYVIDVFKKFDISADRGLPTTPSRLSNQLRRLRPAMEKAGLYVTFLGKDRRGQKVRIEVDPTLCEPVAVTSHTRF